MAPWVQTVLGFLEGQSGLYHPDRLYLPFLLAALGVRQVRLGQQVLEFLAALEVLVFLAVLQVNNHRDKAQRGSKAYSEEQRIST